MQYKIPKAHYEINALTWEDYFLIPQLHYSHTKSVLSPKGMF